LFSAIYFETDAISFSEVTVTVCTGNAATMRNQL